MRIDDDGWTQCGCDDYEPEPDPEGPYRFGCGDAEPCGFMWQPSYTVALDKIPTKELQVEFAMAVIRYGAFGTEPFLDYPLNVVFETVRPNLDYSKTRTECGKKGGRPKKKSE